MRPSCPPAGFRRRLFLTVATVLLALPLAACDTIGMSREAKEQQINRMLEEMKGPEIGGMDAALLEAAEQAEKGRNYQLAAQYYSQLMEKHPDKEIYTFLYAENLRRAGNFDEALSHYHALLDSKELRLDALEGAGLTLMAKGEFEEAGNMLADVMEQDTTRWRTINAIGILFTTKQMYPEARQYFAEALAQSPRNASVHNNMGLMEALDKQYEEAIRLLRESARLTPRNEAGHKQAELNLALVYAIKGDLDMAERTARQHLTETQLLNNMGYYAHLANDDVLAKSYLNMALTASDKHYEKAWKNLETLNKLINSTPRQRN